MRTVPDGGPSRHAGEGSRNARRNRHSVPGSRSRQGLHRHREQQARRDRASATTERWLSGYRSRPAASTLSAGGRKTTDRGRTGPRSTFRRPADRRGGRRAKCGYDLGRIRGSAEEQAADRTRRDRYRPGNVPYGEPEGQDRHADLVADRIRRRNARGHRQDRERRPDDGPGRSQSGSSRHQRNVRYSADPSQGLREKNAAKLHQVCQMRRRMPHGTRTLLDVRVRPPVTLRGARSGPCHGLHRVRLLFLHLSCLPAAAGLYPAGQVGSGQNSPGAKSPRG